MTRAISLAVVLCFLLIHPANAQSSTQPSSKTPLPAGREGVITGRVIGDDGQPIAKAMIEYYSIAAKPAWFLPLATDADGNFKLTGLMPAPYVLKTFVPGYVIDRRSQEARFHRIGEHVTLNMVKGGVITGQVTDANGEPMVGIRVIARIVRDLDGGPVQVQMRGDYFSWGRMTDDRGIYRLYGLEPGVYIIFINRGGEYLEMGTTPELSVYHPSSTRESAAEITVESGQEMTGIDIRHRINYGHIVSGKVVGVEGGFDRAYVMINSLVDGLPGMGAGVQKSGGFEIRGVADGEYEIMAGRNEDGRSMTASMPRKVTIKGADVSGIELKVEKLGSISGRVVKEAFNTPVIPGKCKWNSQNSLEEILFNVTPVQGTSLNSIITMFQSRAGWNGGSVDQKGEFKLTNLFAGTYQLVPDLPGDSLFLRSITRSGSTQNAAKPVEISSSGIAVKSGESITGLEVKIADGAASLSGKVVPATETDKLPKRIQVHLIPSEVSAANEVLRYAEANIGSDGLFEFNHIAPGRYWLLAVPAIENDQNRPVAWDSVERLKLRREAEAAKNEITLDPCQRMKDHIFHIRR